VLSVKQRAKLSRFWSAPLRVDTKTAVETIFVDRQRLQTAFLQVCSHYLADAAKMELAPGEVRLLDEDYCREALNVPVTHKNG
jgi:hypothetical protein